VKEMLPDIDMIMRYESGELTENEVIELFQDLVNSGLAWQLQGHYGRTAMQLIKEGYVHENTYDAK
jgi:hypothetical protein